MELIGAGDINKIKVVFDTNSNKQFIYRDFFKSQDMLKKLIFNAKIICFIDSSRSSTKMYAYYIQPDNSKIRSTALIAFFDDIDGLNESIMMLKDTIGEKLKKITITLTSDDIDHGKILQSAGFVREVHIDSFEKVDIFAKEV